MPPIFSVVHLLENQYQHLLIATALALEVERSLRARGAYDPDAYEADALRDHVTHTAVLREIIHQSQREAEDDIRIAEGLLPLTRTRCRCGRFSLILPEMLLVGRKTFLYTKIL